MDIHNTALLNFSEDMVLDFNPDESVARVMNLYSSDYGYKVNGACAYIVYLISIDQNLSVAKILRKLEEKFTTQEIELIEERIYPFISYLANEKIITLN